MNALTATRIIVQLQDKIEATPSGTPYLDSARVCLEDACACYAKGDYVHAESRAEKGLRYA